MSTQWQQNLTRLLLSNISSSMNEYKTTELNSELPVPTVGWVGWASFLMLPIINRAIKKKPIF